MQDLDANPLGTSIRGILGRTVANVLERAAYVPFLPGLLVGGGGSGGNVHEQEHVEYVLDE